MTEEQKVIDLDVITSLDLNPDKVLRSAIGKVREIVLVGYDNEGKLYFASSKSDCKDIIWLLERAKKRLLEVIEEE